MNSLERIRPATAAPQSLGDLVSTFGLGVVGDEVNGQVSGIASDNRALAPGEVFAAQVNCSHHFNLLSGNSVGKTIYP